MICRIANIELDTEKHRVTQNGQQVHLTQMEHALLQYFFLHPNHLCSREDILNQVWGQRFHYDTGTIDVHIHSLRKKLGFTRQTPIEAIRGVGIIFHSETNKQVHTLNIQQFAKEWVRNHETDFTDHQLSPYIKLDPFISEITMSPKELHEMLDGILKVLLPVSKSGVLRFSSKLGIHHFSLSIDINGTVNELRIPLAHT